MRAVKSRDTGPEMIVRRIAHGLGFRYRLHRADLPGRPDMTFPARRAVIFANGCFWHGHGCKRGARAPKANVDYWAAKIARNKKRDRATLLELKAAGWRALVLWECELGNETLIRQQIQGFLGERESTI